MTVRGLLAQRHLAAARLGITRLRADLVTGDAVAVDRQVADLRDQTGAARRLTSDPGWRAAAALPFAGPSLRTAAGLAAAADDLATGPLPTVVGTVTGLRARLRSPTGGIDLAQLLAARAPLAQASSEVERERAAVARLPARGVIGPVAAGRATLARQLDALSGSLGTAAAAAALAPPMLGADGPRHYFVAFQTNAEARGTGGLVGVFALVTADHGALHLDSLHSDGDLPLFPAPVVDLGPDFAQQWGATYATRLVVNANVSPHFPDAAAIWTAMWQQHTGQRVDGVVGLDPQALANLLAAVGPVRLPDGGQVSADNVVALTERDAYARFAGDVPGRKAYLSDLARAVFDHLATSRGAPGPLLSALGRSVGERRLLVASSRPDEQAQLGRLPVGGALSEAPGPFALAVVNDIGGGKMGYYLHRQVRYDVTGCRRTPAVPVTSTITVRLGLQVPAGPLPDYVVTRADQHTGDPPRGSARYEVSVYASVGARLAGFELDSAPTGVRVGQEHGHPVASFDVELVPGEARSVTVHLAEPDVVADPGLAATVPVQPLVVPEQVAARRTLCGRATTTRPSGG